MAIIPESEFLSHLQQIQDSNYPSVVVLPDVKTVYDIDLDTREITAPKFLGVLKDHSSETIYFRINRFHDFMDLANVACIIQYTTPDQQDHIYAVPFYDLLTERKNDKMLFPWCIDSNVTKYNGPITFSIRFFRVEPRMVEVNDYKDEGTAENNLEERLVLIYNLSTLPATSTILNGMEIEKEVEEFITETHTYGSNYEHLLTLISNLQNSIGVKWTIIED